MYEIGEESGELEFLSITPFSMPSGGLEILEKAHNGEIDPLDHYRPTNMIWWSMGWSFPHGAVRNHDPEIMIRLLN